MAPPDHCVPRGSSGRRAGECEAVALSSSHAHSLLLRTLAHPGCGHTGSGRGGDFSPRDLTPAFTADNRSGLKITKGAGVLPNEHGQVWREYDISPYTQRVRDVDKPEQAVIDWILRETGTEVWFAEPLGILKRQQHHAARLSHARDAASGCAASSSGSSAADAEAARAGRAADDGRQPELAGAGRLAAEAGRCEVAGRRGVAACRARTRRRSTSSSRRAAIFASTVRRASRSPTANRKRWPARSRGPTRGGVQLKQRVSVLRPDSRQDRRRLFAGDQPADVARRPDDRGGDRVPGRSSRKARAAGDRCADRQAVAARADSSAADGELAAERAVSLAGRPRCCCCRAASWPIRAGADGPLCRC